MFTGWSKSIVQHLPSIYKALSLSLIEKLGWGWGASGENMWSMERLIVVPVTGMKAV